MRLKYEPASEPQVGDTVLTISGRDVNGLYPPTLWVGNSVGNSDVEGNSDVW